ncbi:hypothetical protein XM38_020450 [Halomicronema hongdechloris C2206]|uniref:Polymerase beta nucleotidyltransferase domain-containing protein n=1 Tax=Halomicronema hongdechloris C2206 TaxID=1641165 RepID=A0A1Z3HLD5_9CYAN|nr:nucleotidyltransferase domain-containing protein [Halomicronema hongdechloris]ASC71095.1 hypothetical protein XM38_020450 [Halomicronema hongdechloris C2206]
MSEPPEPVIDPAHLAYWQRAMARQAQTRQQAQAAAWEAVQQMAACLRQEFGATRVIAFGSLVRHRFTDDSDIDLAAADIPAERYFEAVARVNEFSPRWVDLKPLEALEPHFRRRVLSTGIDIDARD